MAGKSPPSSDSELTQTRDERLKAALRANLGRRKAQARARKSLRVGETDKKTGKSEG